MKWLKFCAVFVLMVLAVSLAPGVARADEPDEKESADPKIKVGKIVPFEKIIEMPPSAIDESGCKTRTQGIVVYNSLGQALVSYAWNVYWCYDGTKITELEEWKTIWTNNGWSFQGEVSELKTGGVGKKKYRHYAQADFCFLSYFSCVYHSYPWIDVTVKGNGNSTGSDSSKVGEMDLTAPYHS